MASRSWWRLAWALPLLLGRARPGAATGACNMAAVVLPGRATSPDDYEGHLDRERSLIRPNEYDPFNVRMETSQSEPPPPHADTHA